MSGSGQVVLPVVREWSGVLPGCPGVVGSPPECPGVFGRHSRMSLVVERPYRLFGSVREAVPYVREWSRGPPGCPGVVDRPRDVMEWREALSYVC